MELDLIKKLHNAHCLANQIHKNQKDKAGEDYINHPLRICEKIERCKYSNKDFEIKMKIVALLHDVVEDSSTITIDDIEREFGSEIANAIDAISHRPNEPYSDYIQRCKINVFAREVKEFDLEDNLNIIRLVNNSNYQFTDRDWKRLNKYVNAYRELTSIPRLRIDF